MAKPRFGHACPPGLTRKRQITTMSKFIETSLPERPACNGHRHCRAPQTSPPLPVRQPTRPRPGNPRTAAFSLKSGRGRFPAFASANFAMVLERLDLVARHCPRPRGRATSGMPRSNCSGPGGLTSRRWLEMYRVERAEEAQRRAEIAELAEIERRKPPRKADVLFGAQKGLIKARDLYTLFDRSECSEASEH